MIDLGVFTDVAEIISLVVVAHIPQVPSASALRIQQPTGSPKLPPRNPGPGPTYPVPEPINPQPHR